MFLSFPNFLNAAMLLFENINVYVSLSFSQGGIRCTVTTKCYRQHHTTTAGIRHAPHVPRHKHVASQRSSGNLLLLSFFNSLPTPCPLLTTAPLGVLSKCCICGGYTFVKGGSSAWICVTTRARSIYWIGKGGAARSRGPI